MTTQEAIDHWRNLVAEQPNDSCGRERAALYAKTVKALELKRDTGKAYCSCCLKPLGGGSPK